MSALQAPVLHATVTVVPLQPRRLIRQMLLRDLLVDHHHILTLRVAAASTEPAAVALWGLRAVAGLESAAAQRPLHLSSFVFREGQRCCPTLTAELRASKEVPVSEHPYLLWADTPRNLL